MTNSELREKYPIGTKIKWVLDVRWMNDKAKKDVGKTGKIVGYDNRNCPFIFLPESKHFISNSTQAVLISWLSSWKNLEILLQKNQQLLFAFMEQT